LRSEAAGLDEEDGDEAAPASPVVEATASGHREGAADAARSRAGAAVAAGAEHRRRNPFLPLIPNARNGAERRGGPFYCCSCFPAFQDVVPEQAPRDGPHEAVRILDPLGVSSNFP